MQKQSYAKMFGDPVKAVLSGGFLAILALSIVKPPYPDFLLLQHVLTAIAAIVIPLWNRRWPISRGSYACLMGMLVLHAIGARYIYSFVPYDAWIHELTGLRLSNVFELKRNHYDRVVHFCFGLLLIMPIREFLEMYCGQSRASAIVTAVLVIMAASMLYEIAEWLAAVTFSPTHAEAYNGQQGDFWDAQKDMTLALGGALLAGAAQWKYSLK